MEKIYSVKEVAEMLKVNINTVHKFRKSGLLKCIKIGSFKIRESSLSAFLEKYDGMDISDPENVRELT